MIKKLIRKIFLREKGSSKSYLAYLKKKGVAIGKNCYIPDPSSVLVDLTAPWLITLGDNVTLTRGAVILTHDYSWSVFKKHGSMKGSVLGAQAPVKIGSNVFVGVNTVITRGVTIGDNVIIGVGSVVTKDCESNSVYAGNPAKKLMTLEDFTAKRVQKQFEEARGLALAYRERFGCQPPREIFREYFMLFCTGEQASGHPEFRYQMETGGNYAEAAAYMNAHKPMFDSYEAFLNKCYE